MIVATGLSFPEGPVVDGDGTLYCCNLGAGNVSMIDATGLPQTVISSPRPNGLAIHPLDGSFWIADSQINAILRVCPNDTPKVLWGRGLRGPNDLVFASDGTLYFTDPGQSSVEKPDGAVYRLSTDCKLDCVATGLAFPNGISCLRNEFLFVSETKKNQLISISLISGDIITLCEGIFGPDGIAVDVNHLMYVALYREGCVAVINTAGQLIRKIPVMDSHPTNCTIAENKLYVTLADSGRIQMVQLRD